MGKMKRRKFLKLSAASAAAAFSGSVLDSLAALSPVEDIKNPLAYYPDKDWEKAYHNQYKEDFSFKFLCGPNDTHNCRLNAFVRNGVITRMEQAYEMWTRPMIFTGTKPPRPGTPGVACGGWPICGVATVLSE